MAERPADQADRPSVQCVPRTTSGRLVLPEEDDPRDRGRYRDRGISHSGVGEGLPWPGDGRCLDGHRKRSKAEGGARGGSVHVLLTTELPGLRSLGGPGLDCRGEGDPGTGSFRLITNVCDPSLMVT